MRANTLHFATLATAMAAQALFSQANAWERGFVVDNYEPAFYYGGKLGSTEAPGSDCPKGTIPDNDYNAVFKTPWRSDAEVKPVVELAAHADVVASFGKVTEFLAHRSFRSDIDTYVNPFTAPDPGMQQVTGKIAEGFDLDGKANTGGFTSTAGQKGIDNNFYRAWGCTMSFRGTPYHAYLSQRANDKMLDGLYTMVVRISGSGKNPMNDDNAIVEIGYSPDPVMKDPSGRVVGDYSFRLSKMAQYTKLKAKIRNGVVETEQVAVLRAPEFTWGETGRGEAAFQKGKLRLTIAADGSASGLIGGYRDWRDLYAKDTFNVPSEGSTREIFYHENQVAMYYALARNADGIPDPKTGLNTAISTAYRFTAQSAYVVDPAKPAQIIEPPYPNADRAYDQRALFIKATTTKVISPELAKKGRANADTAAPQNDKQDTPKPQVQASNAP